MVKDLISKKFFKEFALLVIAVGVLHFIATYYDLYWNINEFDSLMHFLGGTMVGMAFIFAFYFSGLFRPQDTTLLGFVGIAILGIAFVGVTWEIYELLAGTALAGELNYWSDTTLDFVMDGLGSLTAAFYAFSREVSIEKKEKNG